MDLGIGLCQPSTAILLVSIAGVLYHLIMRDYHSILWWGAVGVFGTGIFQALCFGGLEPVAWVLMFIPVIIVCFFMAIALFASRMRIQNVMSLPCDSCGRPRRQCSCNERKPRCNKTRCDHCNGCGCPYCLLNQQAAVNTYNPPAQPDAQHLETGFYETEE
jgi:hypothetical protein